MSRGLPARWLVLGASLSCSEPAPAPVDSGPSGPPCEGAPGAVVCASREARVCDGQGHARATEDCARAGSECLPGRGCVPCLPGAVDCGGDGLHPRTCAPDGSRWVEGAACDPSRGEVCDAGRCAVGCAESAARHEVRGCDFWAVQTLNSTLSHGPVGVTREDFPFALVVQNPWPSSVRVTLEGGALTAPVEREVPARGTVTLTAPWQLSLAEGGSFLGPASALVRGGALHLRASAPVTAYQWSPLRFLARPECEGVPVDACYSYTGDASRLIPTAALGRDHVALTLPTQRVLGADATEWSSSSGFVSVVGTEAGTRVTLSLTSRVAPGEGVRAAGAGESLEVTLGAGDVLQVLSFRDGLCARDTLDPVTQARFCHPVAGEDLTGTLVRASAPVAVYSGHDCALVPFDRYACDHLEEPLPPVEALGSRYFVARALPVYPRRKSDHPEGEPTVLRVVAVRDGTAVTFEPASAHAPVTLARGESLTFEFRDDLAVQSSSPLLVATLLVGGDYFRAESSVSRSLGDPALAIETPLEQYRSAYDLFVPEDFRVNAASLITPRGEGVLLDGQPLSAPPSQTLAGRDVYRVDLRAGPHRVESVRPGTRFGLRVQGAAEFTSYLYSGGGDLSPIAPPL